MKPLILASLLVLAPALCWAADASAPAATSAKAAAKPVAKAPARKAPAAAHKAKPTKTAKAAAKKPKAEPAAETVPEVIVLTEQERALGERVYTGRIVCELGATVQIDADPASPGAFFVSGRGFKYHMRPVVAATSAVRLEDQKAGAVWIQIANKSMLMNQKLGQRMADECMSEQQAQVTQALKTTPAPSLFDSAPIGSR
ncbi:hypothetical protein [Comamonas flocculans]|uniref:Uncharacterized protein n=1 Tax=Comamonas flocculans TaxID=2597701 RepID=A0A5B8RRI0_9BURK|nr:hypothetical protein [Comamonas flocculans]QEA11623.1 hypothetical protein FOZ74_00355 [Comamonas flocculans]